MRSILSLVFILISIHSPSQTAERREHGPKLLLWNKEKQLNWEDFKGEPKNQSHFAAECNWEIKYNYSFNENRKHKLLFDVYCYFNRSKSWVKDPEKNDALLDHEQLHFDIAELCSRKLRKELSHANFTKDKFKSQINLIFEATLSECDRLQSSYDEQTNHGLAKRKQEKWNKEIRTEIEELEDFSLNNQSLSHFSREETPAFLARIFKKSKN